MLAKVFHVGEYIEFLNIFFKNREDRVMGEVSQCKVYGASGHVYFTIKDKRGMGVLDCIMWVRIYAVYGVKLEVGMEVVVSGHPNVYAPTGRFSLICDAVELVGEGALKKVYDTLKNKLEEEGIFDASRKRSIPEFAQKIGIVTSRDGAVIHDFVNNLGKFGFTVSLVDSRVEGQAALKDLHAAVRTMRKQDIEVLVIIRGGGSLESLQAFNNESLIREIMDFPVPVIAGIGHDKDVPLLALAADAMTSTPTAAAHLVNLSWEKAYAKLRELPHVFARIAREFTRINENLNNALMSVIGRTEQDLRRVREGLAHAEQMTKVHDPARQLKLGYAIARRNGNVLRSVHHVKNGDAVETQLSDGMITSRVGSQQLF